jgi:hypothetical protein
MCFILVQVILDTERAAACRKVVRSKTAYRASNFARLGVARFAIDNKLTREVILASLKRNTVSVGIAETVLESASLSIELKIRDFPHHHEFF